MNTCTHIHLYTHTCSNKSLLPVLWCPGESMLMVDEGSTVCLCGGVLGASDPDSPPEELTFHLETFPLHGFLENTLPSLGSEKSNAGLRVGQCLKEPDHEGSTTVPHLCGFSK